MKVTLAGMDRRLDGVLMYLEPIPTFECPGCYGNAGMDLFDEVRAVTLDFVAMKLTVEK